MKALAALLVFGLIPSAGRIITFDNDTVGKTPPGWTVTMTNSGGAPRWEVRLDRTSPTDPYVLAQVSDDATGNRCPLAIFDGLSLRDVDVSVRIKPVAGREDRAGGLVWRYRDPNNYYLARANALEKNVAIFRVQNGRPTRIAAFVQHDIPSNGWSILKVSVRGDRFQVYVNHRRLLQAEDRTFRGPGKVGLWTMGDSVTYFDDFRVYPK
jgi:hypothetical protein